MKNSSLFLLDTENMLIGKLTNRTRKEYSKNDKTMFLKNLNNIFGISLYTKEYITNKGNTRSAIGYDKKKNIYLIDFKSSHNDKFMQSLEEDFEFIKENEQEFLSVMSTKLKKEAYLSDISCIVISSYFSEKDILQAKESELPVKLYTWQQIDTLHYKKTSFDPVIQEKNKKEAEKFLNDNFKVNKFMILNLVYDSSEDEVV